MSSSINMDAYWMREALIEAGEGLRTYHELPIASILLGGDEVLGRGFSQTCKFNSPLAHSEMNVLLKAQRKLSTCKHPLVLYTLVEPCIMCLGAAMEAGVDRIVFGLWDNTHGVFSYSHKLREMKGTVPVLTPGVLLNDVKLLMQYFVEYYPNHPEVPYADSLLK